MVATAKVGILDDLADGPPSPTDIEKWLRLVADDYVAAGRIEGIEFVHGWGLGLPSGTAAAVERTFQALVEQGVDLIVGPAIGDNAITATPLAEQFRVPTINWAGSERARSDYMFHLQVGSHEDESILMARHLASIGATRLGVVCDDSPIGKGHLRFLKSEAELLKLSIISCATISPLAEDASAEMAEVLGADPDAIVYFGFGLSARAVARQLTERSWAGPRIMNTAGLHGYFGTFAEAVDGWLYVDMRSDDNLTLRQLCERLDVPPARTLAAAKGYDLGRLVAEAVARAPTQTRDGLKSGLEQVKWLPAAEGFEGTLLGFGNFDRGALHGRYLVLRQWVAGRSIEVQMQ